jgi:SAM-dependent methyltransferase
VRPYSHLARAYDAALGRDNFERTRRAFVRLVRRHGIRFRTAADLGSGTGLFARYLARCWGARVFAVDRSGDMLREAALKTNGERVTPLRQDLRTLSLPERVDLATANFDTLNHLLSAPDMECALRRVARALRPGGHFIFDLITPADPLGGRRGRVRVVHSARGILLQRMAWDPHQHIIRIQVIVWPRGCPVAFVEEHLERAWIPRFIAAWLRDAGFDVLGVYDAETLKRTCRAPRVIFVAERAER